MKIKILIAAVYVTFFSVLTSSAQIYRSCTSTMEFEKGKDTLADAKALKAYMIYNSGSGEFIFKIDLSSVVTGTPKWDTKFSAIEDQTIVFKGNYVGQANELLTTPNDERNRAFTGTLYMNSNWQICTVIVQSINFADKTENKSLKLDIIFDLDPVKLNVPVLKEMTQDPIEIEVKGGYVNLVN